MTMIEPFNNFQLDTLVSCTFMQSEICYMPYTIERFSRSTTAAEEDELNKKFSYR